jgi:hypothetical protein
MDRTLVPVPEQKVVVRFSRARRRNERQGILIEEEALEHAERECLANEEARARRRKRDRERRALEDAVLYQRFAAEISRLFPGCPASRPRPSRVALRRAAADGSDAAPLAARSTRTLSSSPCKLCLAQRCRGS